MGPLLSAAASVLVGVFVSRLDLALGGGRVACHRLVNVDEAVTPDAGMAAAERAHGAGAGGPAGTCWPSQRRSSGSGSAPVNSATTAPSRNSLTAGMPRTA